MTNKSNKSNKQTSNKAVNQTVNQTETVVNQTETVVNPAPEKSKAQIAYEKQLAALIAVGFSQADAEKALAAIKPVAKASGNVTVNAFEEAILKDIIQALKEPIGADYHLTVFKNPEYSDFATIQAKIAEKVGYFKPNANKTGKKCLTSDADSTRLITEAYTALIKGLYRMLPASEADKAGA